MNAAAPKLLPALVALAATWSDRFQALPSPLRGPMCGYARRLGVWCEWAQRVPQLADLEVSNPAERLLCLWVLTVPSAPVVAGDLVDRCRLSWSDAEDCPWNEPLAALTGSAEECAYLGMLIAHPDLRQWLSTYLACLSQSVWRFPEACQPPKRPECWDDALGWLEAQGAGMAVEAEPDEVDQELGAPDYSGCDDEGDAGSESDAASTTAAPEAEPDVGPGSDATSTAAAPEAEPEASSNG